MRCWTSRTKSAKKFHRAETDSGREVKYDPANKPEVSNLISIFAHCAGLTMEEVERRYEGQGYGPFKKELAEVVVAVLEPLQARYREIRGSGEIGRVLKEGAERAAEIANRTVALAKERMGFLPPR